MEERTGRIILMVGNRESGKTTLGKSLVVKTMMAQPHMYALVVDDFDHPDYREGVIEITQDMIQLIIEPRVYRCIAPNIKATMKAVREYAANCIILMEDASKYFPPKMTDDQKATAINTRNRGCDLILMFHSFMDVPVGLMRIANGVYVKKCADTPKKFKSQIPDEAYDKLVKADEIVKKSSNRFEKYPVIIS